MKWENLFSARRPGHSKITEGPRSGFQRDFDRLIFSSAFRRLQNKTQVFPLPGSTFVHNRLTHSLEVASVGRSLGSITGQVISREIADKASDSFEFYKYELANVIAAGGLAHDIGNPAFGHSGEKAISSYFLNNANLTIEGQTLRSFFGDKEWADVSNFEGNANAIRILTHLFKGRFQSGLGLTYTTLAAILKYPCEAIGINKNFRHRKKYGFFQSEKVIIEELTNLFQMAAEDEDVLCYKRHPFVYLVEAADDICYSIIDMEDAHRLGILSHNEVKDSFLEVIRDLNRPGENVDRISATCNKIGDLNEKISYLRAKLINLLTLSAADVFLNNRMHILEGTFNDSLIGYIEKESSAFEQVAKISNEKIYNHDSVLEIEISGYNVMSELLDLFVPALLKKNPAHKDLKIHKLFPLQFKEFENATTGYERVLNALDLISGMTDLYATELYRKLKGIDIPRH